jgi:hypothetical protein
MITTSPTATAAHPHPNRSTTVAQAVALLVVNSRKPGQTWLSVRESLGATEAFITLPCLGEVRPGFLKMTTKKPCMLSCSAANTQHMHWQSRSAKKFTIKFLDRLSIKAMPAGMRPAPHTSFGSLHPHTCTMNEWNHDTQNLTHQLNGIYFS